MIKKISVNPQPESNRYYIKIGSGIHNKLGHYVQEYYQGKKIFLVSDKNVYDLHGARINSLLQKSGYQVITYIVPPGEGSKSSKYLQKGYNKLITNNFDRNDFIIAFGGGVVGDLAGYLAATYMRGLPVMQIPTTLLAQVDSSVGGKTAINHPQGKNLIGSFYQPVFVLIDMDFLQTLPEREMKSGMAEVIKYGLINNKKFFAYLKNNKDNVYKLKREVILNIIEKCCQIKAQIVNIDQKERGKRVILNFGHTIGHGLEAVSAYKVLKHGEAVAIGMLGAAQISYYLDYISSQELKAIKNIIIDYGFEFALDINTDNIYQIMKHDKKVKDNKLRWVLLEEIGSPVVRTDINKDLVTKVLEGLSWQK